MTDQRFEARRLRRDAADAIDRYADELRISADGFAIVAAKVRSSELGLSDARQVQAYYQQIVVFVTKSLGKSPTIEPATDFPKLDPPENVG